MISKINIISSIFDSERTMKQKIFLAKMEQNFSKNKQFWNRWYDKGFCAEKNSTPNLHAFNFYIWYSLSIKILLEIQRLEKCFLEI